jgi:hypothetical protein
LLVRADADTNRLRVEKDLKERVAQDFDISGRLSACFLHVWDYARLGSVERVRLAVVTRRYGVDEQTPKKRLTPLHVAVEYRQVEVVRALVLLGADLAVRTAAGLTALQIALAAVDTIHGPEIVTLLRKQTLSRTVKMPKGAEKAQNPVFRILEKQDVDASFCIDRAKDEEAFERMGKETEGLWREIRDRIVKKGITLREIFEMMDGDKDEALSFVEFHGMIIWLGLTVKLEEVKKLATATDRNHNGRIEFEEVNSKMQELSYKEKVRELTVQALKKGVFSVN